MIRIVSISNKDFLIYKIIMKMHIIIRKIFQELFQKLHKLQKDNKIKA